MIAYKDFGLPKSVTTGTLLKVESLVAVPFVVGLRDANAWLEEERKSVQVVSVETVQLEGTPAFIRVWYTHRQPL